MEPNAILEWILRLRSAIDASIDQASPLDADAVYTLVGLIDEMDAWLTAGGTPPERWRAAFARAAPASVMVLQTTGGPSNDAPKGGGLPVRRRRARKVECPMLRQLALPFAS